MVILTKKNLDPFLVRKIEKVAEFRKMTFEAAIIFLLKKVVSPDIKPKTTKRKNFYPLG